MLSNAVVTRLSLVLFIVVSGSAANGPRTLIAAPSKYLSAWQGALALQRHLSSFTRRLIYGLADRRWHYSNGLLLSHYFAVRYRALSQKTLQKGIVK